MLAPLRRTLPRANGIEGGGGAIIVVFETCAHAPIYESVAEFNEKTLNFLKRHT